MKKISILILTVAMALSVCSNFGYSAAIDDSSVSSTHTLNLAIANSSDHISSLAAQHLSEMKTTLSQNPESLGFSEQELRNLQLGNPFSVYTFDQDFQLIPSSTISFPLLYSHKIVGILHVTYDPQSRSYAFTFGKSFGPLLNDLGSGTTGMTSNNYIIANYEDVLFATDSKSATILQDNTGNRFSSNAITEILAAVPVILEKSGSVNYTEVITPVLTSASYASPAIEPNTSSNTLLPMRSYPNPLPVPHIAQTGSCGVAAWAAVLNYRFNTNYTNDTFATAMYQAGYTAEYPSMDDFKNFTNVTFSGGCNSTSTPPSYTTLKAAINAGRPMMGNWFRYLGDGGKSHHAVLITGYIQKLASYTYYVKNPWYSTAETITVTNASSVVYSAGGYTYYLKETVY